MSTALIIGGSSGLGLELGILLSASHKVIVTGRHNPNRRDLRYEHLDLSSSERLARDLDELLVATPRPDLVIYAAGFYQEARLDQLTDAQVDEMLNVGLRAPAFLMKRILLSGGPIDGFIAITSTSQWTPRRLEPVYTAVKAGVAMLADSLAEDGRIRRVMVAGPSGMNTPLWRSHPRNDAANLLDPAVVAKEILKAYATSFKFMELRILRDPLRVEITKRR